MYHGVNKMVADQRSINVLSQGRKPTVYKFVKWNPTICDKKCTNGQAKDTIYHKRVKQQTANLLSNICTDNLQVLKMETDILPQVVNERVQTDNLPCDNKRLQIDNL
jgi:hypothetical protein